MFRFKSKRKRKEYELRTDQNTIQIPLTFHGKSVELNSQVLGKGKYTLCSDDQNQPRRVPVMVM